MLCFQKPVHASQNSFFSFLNYAARRDIILYRKSLKRELVVMYILSAVNVSPILIIFNSSKVLIIFYADCGHNIDRGWLTCQSEIQILIHGRPLTLQGHTEDEVPPFSLKVIAREERVMTPDEESTSKKCKKVYEILPVFIRVSITM